jgi:hypothetical protein
VRRVQQHLVAGVGVQVVMKPRTRPNSSLRIFAIGATQLVVQDAQEITSWRWES